jgi:hypothetical protein
MCWRWEESALARLCRSMSFSGFGGIGGAGRLVEEWAGMLRANGASIRSGGGRGLGCG